MKGSFEQGIRAFQKKLETELKYGVIKVVFVIHGRIVMRSPVDTGRYRAANQINLNSLPESTVLVFKNDGTMAVGKEIKEQVDPGGGKTVADGRQAMASYSLGDTVFLYNNVVYAAAIEEGHSGQAPQGIYRIAAAEMIAEFERMAKAGV